MGLETKNNYFHVQEKRWHKKVGHKMENFNIDDVEIIENYPEFNPKDVSDIMLSIGWGTKEILEKVPDHARYHYYQEVDYYLLAK